MFKEKEIINKHNEVFRTAVGIVKSYNKDTGYGFIFSIDEPDKDIYVHYTNIIMEGRKELDVGDKVEFLYKEHEDKGLRAYSVKRVL